MEAVPTLRVSDHQRVIEVECYSAKDRKEEPTVTYKCLDCNQEANHRFELARKRCVPNR